MAKARSKEVLTDAKAAKAEPGLHWDSHPKAPPMFGLRVTTAGSRSYFLNYLNHDGVERRITIGRSPTWKVGAAREKAAELRRIVDDGGDPLADKQDRKAAPTIADLVKRFCAEALFNKRPGTQQQYRRILNCTVVPEFGKKKLASLTRSDVERLHVRITGEGQPRRANLAVDVIRLLYTQAAKWGLHPASENPASKLDKNPEPGRERFLTKDELERLVATLDGRKPEKSDVVAAIRLLLLTGARRSEVIDAVWSQFDLDAGTWKKPASKTKQKRDHRPPISPEAVALLRQCHAARGNVVHLGDRVFPSVSKTRLFYEWRQIRRDAGLEDVRIHDLRHSYASFLASSKLSLPIIGALLGHTQARTTQRYAHLLDEPLREATGIIGKLVGGVGQ
jgi:integrase